MEEKYSCKGKYVCIDQPTLKLEIKRIADDDFVIMSTGETTIIDNIWAPQGCDILEPGVDARCQNEFLIDFRKGGLILKKPSGEIFHFQKY